jgi:uncharacterized damage-inducible protein DinB
MTIERVIPPFEEQERAMLEAWLDFHRDTLAVKCDGLTDEQLRERAVPPSGLSLLGLVRHMADGEHQWFKIVLAGEPDVYHYYTDETPLAEFDVDDADVAESFAIWRSECAEARALVAATPSLDSTGTQEGKNYSLRWIMIHMIEEYARHNGHADLIRERIDGTVGA